MTRDLLRSAAALARRLLLALVMAAGAAIWLLVVLAAAAEPRAKPRVLFASSEGAVRAVVIKSSRDLEEAPSDADVRRARAPHGERRLRLQTHYAGSGELATPVRGTIGDCGYFGCPRPGHLHNGVDFLAPPGRPVRAADAGRVALMQAPGASGGYGNFVCLQHRPQLASCYAHLSAFAPGLRLGGRVTRGQLVGLVGTTGSSTAPHLHFEVRRGAASCQSCAVDPLPLLDGQAPQRSVSAR